MPTCCDCHRTQPKNAFAKSQLKKAASERRCRPCAAATGSGSGSSGRETSGEDAGTATATNSQLTGMDMENIASALAKALNSQTKNPSKDDQPNAENAAVFGNDGCSPSLPSGTNAPPPTGWSSGHHDSTSLEPGKKAIIVRLSNRADLNGAHVTIKEQLEDGRLAVLIPPPIYDEPKTVGIKPENLLLRDECPICMETEMDTEMSAGQNSSFYWCCGKRTCHACYDKTQKGPDPHRCPMCRADRTHDCDRAQVDWIRNRAERGDTAAMCNLAGLYDFGNNVTQDQALARVWYGKAASKGHREAAHNLACSHRDGEGGPVNLNEALRLFKFAAERGYVKSMTNVGDAFLVGRGVPKDMDVAERWYRKAAAAGSDRGFKKLKEIDMMKRGGFSFEYIPLGGGRFATLAPY